METKEKNNNTAKNNGTVKGINTVTEDKNKTAFVHGNPVNEVSAQKGEEQKPKEESQAQKAEAQQPQADQAKPQAEPKAEVAPAVAPKPEPFKPVRNLEETIKFLEVLHELKVKRDKYLATLANLDEFEFDLKKENEDFDNFYTGCTLTITDDGGRKFTTKNPAIIYPVSQQVTSICASKLAEVEAGLVITA